MTEIMVPRVEPPWPFEAYAHTVEPLAPDDGGGYLVTLPDMPGCVSDGETMQEAVSNARDAFRAWVSARVAQGRPIPAPVPHKAGLDRRAG